MLVPNIQGLQQTLNDWIKCVLQSIQNVPTFVMMKFSNNPEQNNQNMLGAELTLYPPTRQERQSENRDDQHISKSFD